MKERGIIAAIGFILYGLSALALAGLCVWRLISGHWDVGLILWTIFWAAWFFVQLRRYCKREKSDEE